MRNRIRPVFATVGAVLCALSAWAGVKQAQDVKLVSGWNAFSLGVAPDETADEIFSSWPVERVGYYNPAAFLETKQYSGTFSTEGGARTGYIMWRRGEQSLSFLKHLPVGVYVCFNTNAASAAAFTTTLVGTPAAPRITWHPSNTNDAMNLVGISVADGTTTLGSYLDGFDGGNVNLLKFYGIHGLDETKISLGPLSATTPLADGQVVVAMCNKVTDWSGVLFVSPQYGLHFSTNATYLTFSVRNDSTKARDISVELTDGATALPMPTGLKLLDTTHFTNSWIDFSPSQPFRKTLAAKDQLELMAAVDRTRLGGQAGDIFGGLLTVKDVTPDDGTGVSRFRATVPFEVTSDGGASAENAWPKGIWLASAALDTVTFLKSTGAGDAKAGGTMKVRLPLYVEKNGDMKLLQRFVYGTDTNGTTHVYSPKAETAFPVAIGNVKRVSSAVLPIDAPEIPATSGAFGTVAEFPFTVSENSKVNPYRHVFHPSHDGLKWDFETPTPSGDNFTNYVSTVKPEIFSVKNRITFAWDGTRGTAWNPDEKLSGDLTWVLEGVRHEGAIRMSGRFTMKRISSATLDK